MNCMCLVKSLIFNNKIMDTTILLPPDTLKKSPQLFRFQVRDLIHRDHFVCQKEETMSAMMPGDLVEFEDSICLQIPEIRRSTILLGPVKIVARWKEVSWSHFPKPFHYHLITLPSQAILLV